VPALLLLAAFAFRALGFLAAVIDTDEGLYLVQAREWLRGGWPYLAAWDMHPVGAPAVIALALTLFGESIAAVRVLGLLCVAAAAWALHGAARAAGASRAIGLAAGIIYTAHSARLGGLATNTEILFAPLVAAAMALGLRAAVRAVQGQGGPRWRELLGMGAAIGLAMAIKPVVAPEGCLAFALLAFPAWWHGVLPLRRGLAMAAAYAGLCLLPTLLFGLAYALRGELDAFLDGSFLAPFRYSLGRLPAEEAFHRILVTVLTLLWPMVLSLLALLRWGARRGAGGRLARTGLLWFAVATIGIVAPGYYYPHYFLLWLPPLALLAALGCWALAGVAGPRRRGLAFVLLAGAVAIGSWRADATARVDRGIGLFAPDPVRQVAAAIAAELRPGETIFVFNYHPVVYFLTRAGLPTRFVFPAHLTGGFTQVAGIDTDAEVARVLASRPRFVVVDRGWWFSVRPSAARLVDAALPEAYDLAATVAEERGPVEIWRSR
jgi:4-amino-4-deoxy-L-arabinose transferase-like glycosyltransferase